MMGIVRYGRKEFDDALFELRKAIELNPSNAFAQMWLGTILVAAFGEADEGLSRLNMAMQLSPRDPWLGQMHGRRAVAKILLGDYEGAVEDSRTALRLPNSLFRQNTFLVSALGHLGRAEEAELAKEELLRRQPNFTISWYRKLSPGIVNEYNEKIVEGLRKAGLPEE